LVFSSHIFFFYFLPLVLLAYYLLPRRGKHILLTLASYLFYGWANPLFVVLMFVSTLIDYIAGLVQTGQFSRGAGDRPVPMLPPIPVGSRPARHWSNWLLIPFIIRWVRMETPGRTRQQKMALLISLTSNLALLGVFKYFNFGIDAWNSIITAAGWEAARWDTLLRITLPLGISFYTFQSMSYACLLYTSDAADDM
jgi:alginate O-acetyltransferase complex protein AlgI